MGILDRETGQGKVDLLHGRIEHIIDNAAKNAGLMKAQYKCWEKAEGIDARVPTRGRRIPERIKEREGIIPRNLEGVMIDNVEQR